MNIEDVVLGYAKRDTGHKRKVGRYNSSELYYIKKGEVKAEDFFNRELDNVMLKFAEVGNAFEDRLNKQFIFSKVNLKTQVKREVKIDDLTLVVTTDFELDDKVIETKVHSPYLLQQLLYFFDIPFTIPFRTAHQDIPDKYLYQLEAQYRATGKQIYIGKFVIPFDVHLFPYEPSDERWEEIKDIVRKFDKEVRKIHA